MKNNPEGFTYSNNNHNEVVFHHHGKFAGRLRKEKVEQFLQFAEKASDAQLQLKMAKLTGNYKHGNERLGKNRRN